MLCLIFDCSTFLGLIIFGHEAYGFDFLGLNLLGLFMVFMVCCQIFHLLGWNSSSMWFFFSTSDLF